MIPTEDTIERVMAQCEEYVLNTRTRHPLNTVYYQAVYNWVKQTFEGDEYWVNQAMQFINRKIDDYSNRIF